MKKSIISQFIFTLLIICSACDTLLEESPDGLLSQNGFYTTETNIESAIIGTYDLLNEIYVQRQNYLLTDVASDDFGFTKTNSDRVAFEIFEVETNNNWLLVNWEDHYSTINRANAIIEKTPEADIPQEIKNKFIGETMFLRALMYFRLVRLFGDIPLIVEETNTLDALEVSRSPESNVYDQIIEDLIFAVNNIPSHSDQKIGRADKGSAKALLADVYLTKASTSFGNESDYLSATKLAEEVINSADYVLFPSYTQAFDPRFKNGVEHIFSIQGLAGVGGNNQSILPTEFLPRAQATNTGPLGERTYSNFHLTEDLYESFEEGDIRKDVIVKDSMYIQIDGVWQWAEIKTWFRGNRIFTFKYIDYDNPLRANSSVNYPVIRYSGLLLSHAEAENEINGPTSMAYESINKVRNRAGLPELSGLTKDQFREAVYKERRAELFAEGKRFFDLKRTNRLKERVEQAKPGVSIELPKHLVFPIPQQELDINPNLAQNSGY